MEKSTVTGIREGRGRQFNFTLKQSIAFAQKDIQQQLRFKVEFLSALFLSSLINLGLFSTVFYGFLRGGAVGSQELNYGNFVAFALLGALAATLFNSGFVAFQGRFVNEKYWQTASGILASPLGAWAILLGVGLAEAVRFSLVVFVFMTLSYLFWPVTALTMLEALAILLVLYLMISGIALIRGVLYLVNENLDPLVSYFVLGTAYVSAFYYPASFIPALLQPLALINPVYFAVSTVRSIWLGLPVQPSYIIISVFVAIASPLIGTYAFRKVWRNLDITGY